MTTKNSTISLTSAQANILEVVYDASPAYVYLSQDEKKSAVRLVNKGLLHQVGNNKFRVSAQGSKVIRSGNFSTIR
jgi:hypothetical protein